MQKLLIITLLAISYIVTTSSSCNKPDYYKDPCEGVMCTAMFAMINTKVTDANGKALKLDDAYVQRKMNGDTYSPNQSMTQYDSSYVVIDDGYLKNLKQQSDTFYFIGIIKGKQVVNEPFVISGDCCHVSKQSGKDVIVVK